MREEILGIYQRIVAEIGQTIDGRTITDIRSLAEALAQKRGHELVILTYPLPVGMQGLWMHLNIPLDEQASVEVEVLIVSSWRARLKQDEMIAYLLARQLLSQHGYGPSPQFDPPLDIGDLTMDLLRASAQRESEGEEMAAGLATLLLEDFIGHRLKTIAE